MQNAINSSSDSIVQINLSKFRDDLKEVDYFCRLVSIFWACLINSVNISFFSTLSFGSCASIISYETHYTKFAKAF